MRPFLLGLLPVAFLAAETLDFEMSKQEKKQTGVNKLTDKEKGALHQWIEHHYTKRDLPIQAPLAARPQISENLQNGQYIRLTDGSLWNIRPSDTPITQSWITPTDILISSSGDAAYPFKLTNSLTGSSVYAQKADTLPLKK